MNFINEHGNTPLHYACFWGYGPIAEDLVAAGAFVSLANKDGDTPLDKARGQLSQRYDNFSVNGGKFEFISHKYFFYSGIHDFWI